jgi:hypothetical protein
MKFLNANLYPFLDVTSNCPWSDLNMSIKIAFQNSISKKSHLLYEIMPYIFKNDYHLSYLRQ